MVEYHPYQNPAPYVAAPDALWGAQDRDHYLDEFTSMFDSLAEFRPGYASSDSAGSTAPSHLPPGLVTGAQYPAQVIQPPMFSITAPDAQIAHQLPSSIDPRSISLQHGAADSFSLYDMHDMQFGSDQIDAMNQLFTYAMPNESSTQLPTPMAIPTANTSTPVLVQPPVQAPAPVPAPRQSPKPRGSIGPVRNQRAQRESSAKASTTAAAASSGSHKTKDKVKGSIPACLNCKAAKTRCERVPSTNNRCQYCENQNKECNPGGAGSRPATQTISSLERKIRELQGKIERQVIALSGTTGFFGSNATPELQPRPCDCPLDGPNAAHKQGCRVADPQALCMRAQLMDLRSWEEDDIESDQGDDVDMGTGGSESDDRHSGSSIVLPIAASGTPFGMFFELSLELGSPGSENAPNGSPSSSSIGLAGADYFTPGPAARPEIRRIMIEQGKLPSFLIQKSVSPAECLELFDRFMKYWNVSVSVLDPDLHTAKYVLARCPFLFTVGKWLFCSHSIRSYCSHVYPRTVLAVAARDYGKHYGLLMKEAIRLAGESYFEGWKCVEVVQAFILLATFPAPSRRYDEDRTWIYLGGATRMAMDLDLNRPPESSFANETAEREYLNRIRTWLICHNLEVSGAAKAGKLITVQEDAVVTKSKLWWKSSRFNMPYDIHLCAFTQICMIFHKYYRVLVSDSSARAAYTTKDVLGIADQFTKEVQDFQVEFEQLFSQAFARRNPSCEYRAHVGYTAHYFRLVIYSQCYRQSSAQGIQPGNPILLYCIDAATQLVKALTDHHAHSMYFKFSAEGWFTFGAFAGAFMIKLLCPQAAPVIDAVQHQQLRTLVIELINAYKSPLVSIDEQHTPYIYAQFLSRLLARADELNGVVQAEVVQAPKPEMDELFSLPPPHTLAP
ncbi:hypothetical protein FRC07_001117 [Ceratobasidium sp. 392]|nr:hypothetical protein FRC07_001117 [Ceratobasidium sp. 392]